mgnify:CR=1 FL=1
MLFFAPVCIIFTLSLTFTKLTRKGCMISEWENFGSKTPCLLWIIVHKTSWPNWKFCKIRCFYSKVLWVWLYSAGQRYVISPLCTIQVPFTHSFTEECSFQSHIYNRLYDAACFDTEREHASANVGIDVSSAAPTQSAVIRKSIHRSLKLSPNSY